MYNKYAIKEESELVDTFKMLAQAYEEISVIKMQRVRSSVLSTRDFLDELSQVFADVKSSYQQEIQIMLNKKKRKVKINPLTLLSKKRKTVAVLLTPNSKLYGDIINRVYYLFIEESKKNSYDIVIVGKRGKELLDQQQPGLKYKYFELPDDNVTFEDLKPVFSYITDYEKVYVYYGLFNNVITQTPVVSNVTGEQALISEKKDKINQIKYIFEPSLEKIFTFFQNQVFTSLFKQTVHEAELSRLASRITAMEQALSNIETTEQRLKEDVSRLKKLSANKRQLDTFSGIGLWSGRS